MSEPNDCRERGSDVPPFPSPVAPDPGIQRERGHLYRFPFPLRDSLDVSLALPRDLTADEAERLAAFIRTLAQPPQTGNRGSR